MATGADCCDVNIGGRIQIFQDDNVFEGMGDGTLNPRGIERAAGTTASGRMYSTVKPQTYKYKINFARFCDRDPLMLFDAGCKINVTVVEFDTGRRHLFTRAIVTGSPEINTSSGEVSNMVIETDTYQELAA